MKRTLTLRRDTVTELTVDQLVAVAGGITNSCEPHSDFAPCYPTFRCLSNVACDPTISAC